MNRVTDDWEDFVETVPSYTEKKKLLNFFLSKQPRGLKNYSQINEYDFLENIKKSENFYRKQGKVLGIAITLATWDSLLKNTIPISKIVLGGILTASLGEYFLYRNIDVLYRPLDQIFKKNYQPLLKVETNSEGEHKVSR